MRIQTADVISAMNPFTTEGVKYTIKKSFCALCQYVKRRFHDMDQQEKRSFDTTSLYASNIYPYIERLLLATYILASFVSTCLMI